MWNSLHETNGKYENLNSMKARLHYYHTIYCSCSYLLNCIHEYSQRRCTGSGFRDSNLAGFGTFWTNRVGQDYGFIQVSGSGSGFSNFIFGIWRHYNHKKKFCKDLKDVMWFTSTTNVWKKRCYTGHVVYCRAPVHNHSIPSVHYQPSGSIQSDVRIHL